MQTPFLFCRYSAQIDDEELTASELVQALNEIQGQFLPHGAKAEHEGKNTIVVMTPRKVTINSETVVTWLIGNRPGHRTVADYVFLQRGVAKPVEGGSMKANDGLLAATRDLASGGYGVLGFKGTTPDGHSAQIKKPPFSFDKQDNLKQFEKEQPLRIIIESEEDNEEIISSVVTELVRFYEPDDGAPDTAEGTA